MKPFYKVSLSLSLSLLVGGGISLIQASLQRDRGESLQPSEGQGRELDERDSHQRDRGGSWATPAIRGTEERAGPLQPSEGQRAGPLQPSEGQGRELGHSSHQRDKGESWATLAIRGTRESHSSHQRDRGGSWMRGTAIRGTGEGAGPLQPSEGQGRELGHSSLQRELGHSSLQRELGHSSLQRELGHSSH